jgi:hypothetical protein
LCGELKYYPDRDTNDIVLFTDAFDHKIAVSLAWEKKRRGTVCVKGKMVAVYLVDENLIRLYEVRFRVTDKIDGQGPAR